MCVIPWCVHINLNSSSRYKVCVSLGAHTHENSTALVEILLGARCSARALYARATTHEVIWKNEKIGASHRRAVML